MLPIMSLPGREVPYSKLKLKSLQPPLNVVNAWRFQIPSATDVENFAGYVIPY